MFKNIKKVFFSHLNIALIMLCLPLLSQNIKAAQYTSNQSIDMVLTINNINSCEADSIAVNCYTFFEQDATATHIPFQNPFPTESQHPFEDMISERIQYGTAYKKIRSLYFEIFQHSEINLSDNRSHTPSVLFHLSVPLHLESTILRI
jgi:hypothetical protein